MHDYPEIVKRPMDFSTIKKSLQKGGKYETYEDLFADVQLIWDNCKTYNIAGSDIYKLAEYMEKLAKRCIQKFRAANGIQQVTPPPAPKTPAAAAPKSGGDAKKKPSAAEERSEGEEDEDE